MQMNRILNTLGFFQIYNLIEIIRISNEISGAKGNDTNL